MDAWRRDAKRRGPNDAIADRQKAAQAAAAARAFLPPGPRRREASPASPASLGGADRWERKSPAPTPAATVLRGWNRTPEQPMPGAQPLPGLVDTTARKSAPTDDDSEDEGWGRG